MNGSKLLAKNFPLHGIHLLESCHYTCSSSLGTFQCQRRGLNVQKKKELLLCRKRMHHSHDGQYLFGNAGGAKGLEFSAEVHLLFSNPSKHLAAVVPLCWRASTLQKPSSKYLRRFERRKLSIVFANLERKECNKQREEQPTKRRPPLMVTSDSPLQDEGDGK